jgi:hypothetical protein
VLEGERKVRLIPSVARSTLEPHLSAQQLFDLALTAKDRSRARLFYECAANLGHRQSQFETGRNWLLETDRNAAIAWFDKASAQGHVESIVACGTARCERALAGDFERAFDLFNQAIGLGNIRAIAPLGLLYETGQGVAQDCKRAAELYKEADAKGSDAGTYRYSKLLASGQGVDKNQELSWDQAGLNYCNAARRDHRRAKERLAQFPFRQPTLHALSYLRPLEQEHAFGASLPSSSTTLRCLFAFMDGSSLCNVAACCKLFAFESSSELMESHWKLLYKKEFGQCGESHSSLFALQTCGNRGRPYHAQCLIREAGKQTLVPCSHDEPSGHAGMRYSVLYKDRRLATALARHCCTLDAAYLIAGAKRGAVAAKLVHSTAHDKKAILDSLATPRVGNAKRRKYDRDGAAIVLRALSGVAKVSIRSVTASCVCCRTRRLLPTAVYLAPITNE